MVGQTVSHFRILEKLGEGGMGVVYKGEDTRLDRTVALKFLAAHAIADSEARQRFEREAKAAASLDHPNVCTVFEIGEAEGQAFLAMAFVDGQTVKDKIAERPLKLGEALDIAVQTARGLLAAHDKGIVHRDVKPANVMINRQQQVKIMDFGLAQLAAGTRMTQTGSALGTPVYMSPEQAEGRDTDRRTDIWSLGVMLYEMVTGRLPFNGEQGQAVLFAIINTEPEPVTALRAGLPIELDRIVQKCLSKDPAARYQHADDLIVDLEALRKQIDSGNAMSSVARSAQSKSRLRIAALVGAGAAAVAALAVVAPRLMREAPPPPAVKFAFTPAQLLRGGDGNIDSEVSVSRNGKHITYVESQGRQLWIRDIDQEQARPVPGATGVYQAFWSNDDQFIGYSVGAGPDLMRIPAHGGAPARICKMAGQFRRAAWSSDGKTIVYCDTTGLYTVPALGGEPSLILKHPHIEHPSFLDLPGGRRAFLYQAVEGPGRAHEIFVQVVGEDRRRMITASASTNPYPDYSPTGHIVYVDGDNDSPSIWALPFSLQKLEASGKAFPIVQKASSPQVSRTGTLVYSDVPSNLSELVWRDRAGKVTPAIPGPRFYRSPVLSPDGGKVAAFILEGGPKIGVFDLQTPGTSPVLLDAAGAVAVNWAPAGNDLVYSARGETSSDIFARPADGSGGARPLVNTPAVQLSPDWSPSGKHLIYVEISAQTRADILYRLRRDDGSLGDAAAFLMTNFSENDPRFSPDGRHVAYVSNESGKAEVYVRSFPDGGNKRQISANGGASPRWRRDGKEIFFLQGSMLMAASITNPAILSTGPAAMLFDLSAYNPQYDVSADGKRFIVRQRIPNEKPLAVHVVHNWFSEFRGRD